MLLHFLVVWVCMVGALAVTGFVGAAFGFVMLWLVEYHPVKTLTGLLLGVSLGLAYCIATSPSYALR